MRRPLVRWMHILQSVDERGNVRPDHGRRRERWTSGLKERDAKKALEAAGGKFKRWLRFIARGRLYQGTDWETVLARGASTCSTSPAPGHRRDQLLTTRERASPRGNPPESPRPRSVARQTLRLCSRRRPSREDGDCGWMSAGRKVGGYLGGFGEHGSPVNWCEPSDGGVKVIRDPQLGAQTRPWPGQGSISSQICSCSSTSDGTAQRAPNLPSQVRTAEIASFAESRRRRGRRRCGARRRAGLPQSALGRTPRRRAR